MQIVSGASGKGKSPFRSSTFLTCSEGNVKIFINWFNETGQNGTKEVKRTGRSAIAHLYYETIHPFVDGNGRSSSDKALSHSAGRPVSLSVSKTIEADKKTYYEALYIASHDSFEITKWINYFIKTVVTAQTEAEE